MKSIIEAKNIVKKFANPSEVTILSGVNFSVCGGESVAIMGRSGEGKSTLLHILGTLESPTSGELIISGKTVNTFNTTKIRRSHIAFVFQSYHLLDDYSVIDNVLMPARINRQPTSKGSEAYSRAQHLLEMVELSDRLNFSTKLLSGGEKQRVAIARALCNDPDLILADEPSGNLDSETAKIIHDLLISFSKKEEKALILVTHDNKLANLCDRKLTLTNGKLCESH
ncbi:MAG: ABC transporter ATP-binding protein [Chlamydiota bacterium]|nr:ABC transporter ATP-binding protein [Chlamydiota bacterium]